MKRLKEVIETALQEAENELGTLEEKVEEHLGYEIEDFINNITYAVSGCETPIEKLFAIKFHSYFESSRLHYLADIFEWERQAILKINEEKTYRVDFLVSFLRQENNIEYQFVIECDGHDFHEKTKEQAAKDKQRDRDLQKQGIEVIRFTGSEIFNAPALCAREAIRIIEKKISQYRL